MDFGQLLLFSKSRKVREHGEPGWQRYAKRVKERIEGGYAMSVVPKKQSEVTDEEKAFWTKHDKAWAWEMFFNGSSAETVTEFVGGHSRDLIVWIKRVCRGEVSPPVEHHVMLWENRKWTKRQTKILRLMAKHKSKLSHACLLLYRSRENIKSKWREIRDG